MRADEIVRSPGSRFLGPIFRAGLLAIHYRRHVPVAPDDVIAHAGQIPDAASPDQDDGMRLDIVTLARDEGGYLEAMDRRTRATVRWAELGLRGRRMPAHITTPRACGRCCKARLFCRLRGFLRGLRTNWLMVGMPVP
jgi:hypothetical protein